MAQDREKPHDILNWQARFEDNDAPWERGGVHESLRYWQSERLTQPGQRIYVPGCGRSLEPVVLAELGLDVTVSDIAPSAIGFQSNLSVEKSVGISAIETDSLTWRPSVPFDLIYEQTFLCAIPPRLRADYEKMAFECLQPGGTLLCLLMQKEERGGPPYGCDLDAMNVLFNGSRWAWPKHSDHPGFVHPNLNDKVELAVPLTRL